MIKKIINFMYFLRDRQRIQIAISKGQASASLRKVDLKNPSTWEFSGFSQNGEDGILQILRHQLTRKNYYFLEIGAADGIDNNSAWPMIVEKYAGVMIEGSPSLIERAKRAISHYSLGLEIKNLFVLKESVKTIADDLLYMDPDFLSLDIDGNDYYIAKELLNSKVKPKIIVVEYNSSFGPQEAMTIPYQADFVYNKAHESEIYFGVSIMGWRKLFESNGYKFVTVDRKGVNAFFINPDFFDTDFVDNLQSLDFAENELQMKKFRVPYERQFEMIKELPFKEITDGN